MFCLFPDFWFGSFQRFVIMKVKTPEQKSEDLSSSSGTSQLSSGYRNCVSICLWILDSFSVPCLVNHWLRVHHNSKQVADAVLGSCLLPLLSYLLAPELLTITSGIILLSTFTYYDVFPKPKISLDNFIT